MKKDKESLKKKINALFAKANSAGELGNQAEAEIFMAKAQELMTKYNLESDDLSEEDKAKGITIPIKDWFRKTESTWVSSLCGVLAYYNFCRSIEDQTRGAWVIIGSEDNAKTVASLVTMLIPEVRRMCNDECRRVWDGNPNTFKRGYFRGFVVGIKEKLEAQREEQMMKARKIEAGDTTLPAYYGNLPKKIEQHKELVAKFVDKHYPRLRQQSSRKLSGADGFNRGREAGRNANLNRGSKSYGGGQRRLG